VVNPKDDIWERIESLAEENSPRRFKHLWKKQELTGQTDLVSDLGLVGDDASEFMDRYACEFRLEPGDYDASIYFDEEGLWILPTLKKGKEKKHITLGMLYLAAKTGKWDSEKLNQACQNNQYGLRG